MSDDLERVAATAVARHADMTWHDKHARRLAAERNGLLRELRGQGWTLQALADLLGISLSAVVKAVKPG